MGSKARSDNLRLLPKNISFVCFSRSFGGLEMTTLRLAQLLADRGANVHLIVPEGSTLHSECRALRLSHSLLEPVVKYGDLRAAFVLGRIFRRFAIDAAIFFRSQDLHLGALARTASERTHLVFYQQMQSGIAKKDMFHDAVFSRLSAWLTLTDIMRSEVLTWTTMPAEKVHVAYLGRDEQTFSPSQRLREKARKDLGIPPGAFVAGVLGRLDRQKGQLEFLRTFPAVRQSVRNAMFIVAGDETKEDTGMRRALQVLSESISPEGRVRILPPTDDVARFMAALDTFVMPSYSETYGLVLIEAMAMGIPIVTTNSGGVPELVRDGKEGFLVEPKDVDGLAHALIRLGERPALRRSMGSNGRERFLSTFRERDCTDRLVGILTRLGI